jgi:hypothetical protein
VNRYAHVAALAIITIIYTFAILSERSLADMVAIEGWSSQIMGTATLIATPAACILAVSIRHKLPNYGGDPPFEDVVRIQIPVIVTGLIGFGVATVLWKVLQNDPYPVPTARGLVWLALTVNSAVVAAMLVVSIRMLKNYWEDCNQYEH